MPMKAKVGRHLLGGAAKKRTERGPEHLRAGAGVEGRSVAPPRRNGEPPRDDRRGFQVARVRDEVTNKVHYAVEFPTSSGVATHTFGVTDLDRPGAVLKEFRSYEARIPGKTESEQLEFLKTLFESANAGEPKTGTRKPGFTTTGRGFVLGRTMLGDAVGRMYFLDDSGDPVTLGTTRGFRSEHRKLIGLLSHSSICTLAVLVPLASVIPRYFKLWGGGVPGAAGLISETATFNLVAESGSGKTLPLRIAASTMGDPDDHGTWEGSRRGQEEYLSSRNDVGAFFDDLEKVTDAAKNLKAAIEVINQAVPAGRSKKNAKVARTSGLPSLNWSTFALSSSPQSIDVILRDKKWTARSRGENVRLFDISVPPPSEGGCFDERPVDADPTQFGLTTSATIEDILANNWGFLFSDFVSLLLSRNFSSKIVELTNDFVSKVVPEGNSYDKRFAKKFGVLFAVARILIHHKLVDWEEAWAFTAVSRCYVSALSNAAAAHIRTGYEPQRSLINLMQAYMDRRFAVADPKLEGPIQLSDDACGIIHRPKGKPIYVCLLEDSLIEFAGGSKEVEQFKSHIRGCDFYAAGHGAVGTAQESVSIERNGTVIDRPRFWRLDYKKLKQRAKEAVKFGLVKPSDSFLYLECTENPGEPERGFEQYFG